MAEHEPLRTCFISLSDLMAEGAELCACRVYPALSALPRKSSGGRTKRRTPHVFLQYKCDNLTWYNNGNDNGIISSLGFGLPTYLTTRDNQIIESVHPESVHYVQ